jgi:hypothetical protein
MPVSKRLRYEILRRDNHTCRYCGQSAPDVSLTIDHVTPETLGGLSVPENLVTACRDCNAGKSSIAPDSPLVEDVRQIDLRWQGAIQRAADAFRAERAQASAYFDAFYDEWTKYGSDRSLPPGADLSIERFHAAGLPVDELAEIAYIAQSTRGVDDRFRYFCGIAWKRVALLHETAKSILEAEETVADGPYQDD